MVAREREEHGGLKIGSAFFGWLTATGMAVLLSALVAVTGLLAGEATGTDTATEVSDALDIQVESLGVLGIVVALVIMFVAYYSGGYVAGRMARFDGIKQGIAVWGWALVIAVVVGVLGAVADNEYEGSLGMPQVSLDETTTTTAIVARRAGAAGQPGRRDARRPRRHALPPARRPHRPGSLTAGGSGRRVGMRRTLPLCALLLLTRLLRTRSSRTPAPTPNRSRPRSPTASPPVT